MRIKVLLFFISICLSLVAQTQNGYVKTKGRLGSNGKVIKGTRLSGVTIIVKGQKKAVLSGKNGAFTLHIPSNSFYLQNVQKRGHVIVDPNLLSRLYFYSKDSLILVLETQEQQVKDKLWVESKIRRNLHCQLLQHEEEIESLKEENKITNQEYRERLKKLYEEQNNNERLTRVMVDYYSKIDFDQLDDFNAQISKYILNGELQKADSLLKQKRSAIVNLR